MSQVMAKFCPECGENINDEVKFCPTCGANINLKLNITESNQLNKNPEQSRLKIKDTLQNKIYETNYSFDKKNVLDIPKPREKKKTSKIFLLLSISIILIGIFLVSLVLIDAYGNASSTKSNPYQPILDPSLLAFTPFESQTDKNIRIARQTVADYANSHTYFENNIYGCADMASDVWNILETKGVKAIIRTGSVKKRITTFTEVDHAWVMAEVAPNKWLALETTSGEAIEYDLNPLYYDVGWSFSNPGQLKDFILLNKQYDEAHAKYIAANDDYNNVLRKYNSAGILDKLGLKNRLDDKLVVLNERSKDLSDISNKITTMLKNL
jgi:hypothetical protein